MSRRMAEAWTRHQEETGHLDGIAEHYIVYCLNCAWFFAEGAESDTDAITLRDEDFDPPSMTKWQRDLDNDRMRELSS